MPCTKAAGKTRAFTADGRLGNAGADDVPARDDAAALAAKLGALAPADRARTGRELRARVVAGHSTEHWADAVLEVVRSVRG